MMKKFIIWTALILLGQLVYSQQASMTIVGLSGQNMSIAGQTLYLPAGAYWNHTGNTYAGINRLIAGNAGTIITGSAGSRLHILGANQLDGSAPAKATQIDANGVVFDVDLSHYNPLTLQLTDQTFGAVTTNGEAHLTSSRQFAFGNTHPFTGAAVIGNHVVSNNNQFIIGATGSLVGFDASRYVVTNDNAGELRKLGIGLGESFFFPIGRANADYTPARLQVSQGGPADYYMNVRNFAESIPDENIGGYATMPHVSRTWMVYAGTAGSIATMDFIHPGTPAYEANGYNRTNSNVIRFNGNGWTPNLPSDAENESLYGTPPNYWAQQITFAVPTTIGSNSFYGKSNAMMALPVRFGDFSVQAVGCESYLNWTTFSEQDLMHFVVERSYTGRPGSWQAVGKVAAAGNSSSLRQYTARDGNSLGADAFYRLQLIERDGRTSFTDVRRVAFDCRTGITGFPNPVRDVFTLLLPQGATQYSIRVLGATGQDVLPRQKTSAQTITLPMTKLAAGMYQVIVTDEQGRTKTLRLNKL